ncbi:MAG: hypothetical protein ACK5LK_05190 [Chthoniobacterales bacterium]
MFCTQNGYPLLLHDEEIAALRTRRKKRQLTISRRTRRESNAKTRKEQKQHTKTLERHHTDEDEF